MKLILLSLHRNKKPHIGFHIPGTHKIFVECQRWFYSKASIYFYLFAILRVNFEKKFFFFFSCSFFGGSGSNSHKMYGNIFFKYVGLFYNYASLSINI